MNLARRTMPVVALALAACSGAERPMLMSKLPAFDGEVRIETRGDSSARVLAGELTFDRASGSVTFRRSTDGVLLRRETGEPLRRVVDGAEGLPTLQDEGDFAMLMVVLTGAPDERAEVVAIDGGYAVVHGQTELRVVMTPRGSRGT